jgi:hypothetical protein
METLFLTALGLGGVVLTLQILLTLFGFTHDVPDMDTDATIELHGGVDAGADVHVDAHAGPVVAEHETVGASDSPQALNLLSTRALAGGTALFGAVGLALIWAGLVAFLATPAAVAAGLAGAYGTAWLTREMLRLESSGNLRLADAVGQAGTVYLTVKPGDQGGRIQFALQGRTVELRAVTRETRAIPTGTSVVIVGLQDGETVEVVPLTSVEENL